MMQFLKKINQVLNFQVVVQEVFVKRSHIPLLPNDKIVSRKEHLVYQDVGWDRQPVTTYFSPVKVEQSSTAIYTFPSFTEKFIIENVNENKFIPDPKNEIENQIKSPLEHFSDYSVIKDDLKINVRESRTFVEGGTDDNMNDAEGKINSRHSRKQWQEFFKPSTPSGRQTGGSCASKPLLAPKASKDSNPVSDKILHFPSAETKSTVGSKDLRAESAATFKSIEQASDCSLSQ
uniref:Uncharacterized protein n=1 Tax=Graphocephala atropunctata TaxID=36148 RepID=A0A1B6MNG6_9HEMI